MNVCSDHDLGPSAGHDDLRSASTGELVQRLSTQVTDLVRAELALARSELQTKGKRLGIGAGLAGGAGVVAIGGGRGRRPPRVAPPGRGGPRSTATPPRPSAKCGSISAPSA